MLAIAVLGLAMMFVAVVGPLAGSAEAIRGFGGYGTAAGQFIEPHGIAVLHSSRDLYLLDTNNHRIEQYRADGRLVRAWGWGVADGHTPALQICAKRCFTGIRGDGAGQLAFAEGLALGNAPTSPSHGDIYVADISNHRVQKFSPKGRFLLMFGVHVNRSARAHGRRAEEDICPVRPEDRCGVGTAGAGPGQFEFAVEGNYVAVGPDGDVYVGDRNRVEVFDANGVYHHEVRLLPRPQGSGGEVGGVSGLAVDSRGDMYVIRNGVSGIREYTPQGLLLRTLYDRGEPASGEEPTPAIELDSAGHLFVDVYENGQHHMLEYDSMGHQLASFDAGMPDGLHGLAYSQHANVLYLLETNSNVDPPTAHVRIVPLPHVGPYSWLGREALDWLSAW